MGRLMKRVSAAGLLSILLLPATGCVSDVVPSRAPAPASLRIATMNLGLNRSNAGDLAREIMSTTSISTPTDLTNVEHVAAVVLLANPDVIVLQEFDEACAPDGTPSAALRHFAQHHLHGRWPHLMTAPVNTGVASGLDINQDGSLGTPADAFGFGAFPGQYGMAVLSRVPFGEVRTFQLLRWASMPGHRMPPGWYRDDVADQLRLSSKSHWDVELRAPGAQPIHLLVSHPTPPVFDGDEDANGRRNHDEVRFWIDYIGQGDDSPEWIVDDNGVRGGLADGDSFVILGDLNADPFDGDADRAAITRLLTSDVIASEPVPASRGGAVASSESGGVNAQHRGDPAHDTGDFIDSRPPGNLRLDYVLPSHDLPVLGSGVFWPAPDEPGFEHVGRYPFPGSDHRLVWVTVKPHPVR